MIVDFVRYGLGRKNNEIVTYPKSFNLNQYMSKTIDQKYALKFKSKQTANDTQPEDAIYDLYGVIVHQGSSRYFGHYYSFCRGFENDSTWYKCNDAAISKVGTMENAL